MPPAVDKFTQNTLFGDKDAFKFGWIAVGADYTLVPSLPEMFLRPVNRNAPEGGLTRTFHLQTWGGEPVIAHQTVHEQWEGGREYAQAHAMLAVPERAPCGKPVVSCQATGPSASAGVKGGENGPDDYSYCPPQACYNNNYNFKRGIVSDDGHWKHRSEPISEFILGAIAIDAYNHNFEITEGRFRR